MKNIVILFLLVLLISCADSKETKYTASTPAAPIIRIFLGISLTDSVDFIRWNLILKENNYTLHCNYGIGKPNTNGFYNGGKTIELNGELVKEKNFYKLLNEIKILKIAELNSDLLHFLDTDNKLLRGTGGWSYTLNNLNPIVTDAISMTSKNPILKDSMAFGGRTPCGVQGVIEPGTLCYKLKWYAVLYADPARNQPTTYRISGTAWRKEGSKQGTWKISAGKDGRIIYQLYDEKGNAFINFMKPDDNILLLTDANGKLLVGDLDFSYTLSRKF